MHVFKHFYTITKHRLLVRKHCFKCGLYWRGLLHDLSKYSFTEFSEGAKYYIGIRSSISEAKRITGKSEAWLHHKGRNKHHYEYWVDGMKTLVMPYKYAVESICDQLSASKVYLGKTHNDGSCLEFWNHKRDKISIHEDMKKFHDKVFLDLKDYGEKKILNKKYMKKMYADIMQKEK